MIIKTNGYYRSTGTPYVDEMASLTEKGTVYQFLQLNPDNTFFRAYNNKKDFDFISYLNSLSDEEKEFLYHGTFDVEDDNKMKITSIIKTLNSVAIYYYTIVNPELILDEKGEAFEFIQTD